MAHSTRTKKHPGDLVLAENGALYIVNPNGSHSPHEQPRRRVQRLAAEAWRATLSAPTNPAPRRSLLSLLRLPA